MNELYESERLVSEHFGKEPQMEKVSKKLLSRVMDSIQNFNSFFSDLNT
jgi:hypothetical protein